LSCRFLCKTCTVTLSRRYGLMAHRTVDVKQFRELFDCFSYVLTLRSRWSSVLEINEETKLIEAHLRRVSTMEKICF
jgi:hypothetical protein